MRTITIIMISIIIMITKTITIIIIIIINKNSITDKIIKEMITGSKIEIGIDPTT